MTGRCAGCGKERKLPARDALEEVVTPCPDCGSDEIVVSARREALDEATVNPADPLALQEARS